MSVCVCMSMSETVNIHVSDGPIDQMDRMDRSHTHTNTHTSIHTIFLSKVRLLAHKLLSSVCVCERVKYSMQIESKSLFVCLFIYSLATCILFDIEIMVNSLIRMFLNPVYRFRCILFAFEPCEFTVNVCTNKKNAMPSPSMQYFTVRCYGDNETK